jgi:thioredoxin reductase
MFICNDELGKILKEGRGEDLNPCIECHVCRGVSFDHEWMSHCTINPVVGMAHRLDEFAEPVTRAKKVAIIGGGPAGMKCALWLKERGHTPVIFEATDSLGGQIKTSRYPDFKWELCRYLDFLISQMERKNIEVRLNTAATPEMIRAEGFDTVIAAVGAVPKKPDIAGAELAKWDIVNIYGHEDEIGHRVVVIGGASGAAEAAAYLARLGHQVTELSRKNIVAYDLNPIRTRGYMNHLVKESGVEIIAEAAAKSIKAGAVTYTDKSGAEHTIECDDVLAAGGMKSGAELAVTFADAADEFYAIGDARHAGNMRTAIADAYSVAMQI